MKRKLITLLSLVCAIACAFSLAACGGGETNVEATGISLNRETQLFEGILTGDTLQFTVGQTVTLTATLTPVDATSEITWQSNAPKIASVDGNGKITALQTGDAVITATANGNRAMCFVQVLAPSVSDFAEEAAAFVKANIRPQVIDDEKDVKCETWSMETNRYGTIFQFSVLYIYASGKTERTIEFANIALRPSLYFFDFINGFTASQHYVVDRRKTVFEFDTKYNYDNQEIINALYTSENITSDLKVISEAEASYSDTVAYNYVVIKDGKVDTFRIEVLKGKGSTADIIRNFKNGNTSGSLENESYTMNGTIIYSEGTYEK